MSFNRLNLKKHNIYLQILLLELFRKYNFITIRSRVSTILENCRDRGYDGNKNLNLTKWVIIKKITINLN